MPHNSLLFRLWFDNSRENCCQSRLTFGPEPGTVFNSNLFDRIIDIGLPANGPQTVPACYKLFFRLVSFTLIRVPQQRSLVLGTAFKFGAPGFAFGTSDPG